MVKKAVKNTKHPVLHRLIRILVWLVGIAIALVAAVWIAFQVSPWPSALLLREAFDKNAAQRVLALQKYLPTNVASSTDHTYMAADSNAKLDVFYPSSIDSTDKLLPTIVWVHGGGWISGNKQNVDPYLQILASKGYTTVGVDYSIAPEKTYPTPIIEVNEALAYINEHASELHIDKNQIILAGDSAGSQIAAQIAAMTTNPNYASLVDVPPALQPDQLAGMLLTCGAYDLSIINADGNSEGAQLLRAFLWSYSGKKDFLDDPEIFQASVIDYVTKDFPPTFITAGNADPLLSQSQTMAQKLQSLGVTTDTLFYPTNYTPALPHEYQFNLDVEAGQKALDQMTTFLATHAH
jgi:acetyl esterase/lipase